MRVQSLGFGAGGGSIHFTCYRSLAVSQAGMSSCKIQPVLFRGPTHSAHSAIPHHHPNMMQIMTI